MLTSLTLMALIAGDGAFIEGARAALDGPDMKVSIETSGPVEPGDVRTKLHGRHLVVYVDGAQGRPDRTHLGTAERPIAGFLRSNYAKLEIPFPAGARCAGPIAVHTQGNDVSARVACDGAAPAAPAPPPHAHATPPEPRTSASIAPRPAA